MDIDQAIQAHFSFIKRSIDVHGGKGSSAYFSLIHHPISAWSKPYPETTGYLIPTLIQLEQQVMLPTRNLVESCMQWLAEDVQLANGGFPSLFADNNQVSLFNSGQIALGFLAYRNSFGQKYMEAEERLVDWLRMVLESEDQFIHYKQGFIPTYYTRVVWPVLALAKGHGDEQLRKSAFVLFDKLMEQMGNQSFPLFSGFEGNQAYSHTLAYTVRGLLESLSYAFNKEYEARLFDLVEGQLVALDQAEGVLAGSYNKNWIGDFSYRCLTGEWQWVIILLKLGLQYQEERYLQYGKRLMEKALQVQSYPKGAVYGSKPFWGKYMRFKAPNWAAKFALDALLLYKTIGNDQR